MIARDYAKALYAVGGTRTHLDHLRSMLKRRGHTKLAPRIYAEYQKLLLEEERRKKARQVTPEQERTRILLELYRKLTHV